MALKNQPTILHPLKSWGAPSLQGRNEAAGRGPGGGHTHSKPHPFNRPEGLGS